MICSRDSFSRVTWLQCLSDATVSFVKNTRNFNFEKNAPTCFRSGNGIGGDLSTTISAHCTRTWVSANIASCDWRERPRSISRQIFTMSIPSKPHSFHSVHSAIGSRMNGMIFRSFRKLNRSQNNTNTVYFEYSYSGIVSKERALSISI